MHDTRRTGTERELVGRRTQKDYRGGETRDSTPVLATNRLLSPYSRRGTDPTEKVRGTE